MLSEDEKKEISDEFELYEKKSAACIEALRIVQRHRGWVSDEAISDVAGFLGMSCADVDGVATFYNLIFRKPVGRHVIFVCDSVSCWVMGGSRLKDRVCSRIGVDLGQISPDGAFTVLPIPCLGRCESAPVLLVSTRDGQEAFTNLSEQDIDELIERYRRRDNERRIA